MSQPLVSVIVAAYNREKYIKRAVESVFNSAYKDIELILVDDGSTDKTKDIIQPYCLDPRFHYIRQKNKGVSAARNNGIKFSEGKYIAILDSDDYWRDKRKLEKQVKFLEEHPEYVLAGGGLIRINGNNKEIARYLPTERDEEIRELILINNIFGHSSVVFRRNVWESVGGYDEGLCFSEDWDLWLKFGKLGKFYNFQEYFVCYLQGGQNMSNFNIRQNLRINIELREKYRNDYPNFRKAYLFGWAVYFYSFLPFRNRFRPIFLKLREKI